MRLLYDQGFGPVNDVVFGGCSLVVAVICITKRMHFFHQYLFGNDMCHGPGANLSAGITQLH